MATCRDIITRAYHMARVVALGVDPKAKEADFGLETLQSIYDGWFLSGMFSRLTDVYTDADYTAQENERIFNDGATITIPATMEDGTRTPRDLSAISVITSTTRANYVYADGAWETLTGLTLNDEAPLSTLDRSGLSALLAEHLAETFGGEIGPLTHRKAMNFQGALMYKLGSTRDRTAAEYY